MKSMAILPVAVTALLALHVSAATSQEICSRAYVSCINACIGTKVSSIQESCIQACERKNDFCSNRVFSGANHVFSDRNMSQEAQAQELNDWLAKIDSPEPDAADQPQQPQQPRRGTKPARR
jgi:hypothetical protein